MLQRAIRGRAWLGPLVAALGVALLGGRPAGAEGPYAVDMYPLHTIAKDQVHPRISDTLVVWKDYRNLSSRTAGGSAKADIYALDLTTGREVNVVDSKDAGDPDISGTIVVWTAEAKRKTEIHATDLQTGDIFAVSDSPGHQERPAISGTLIVWQDDRNGNWDIFARDLSGDGEEAVVKQPGDQVRPAVSGRTVVWEDWRDRAAGPDVYGADLDAHRTFRITRNRDAFEPAISGRWVVWVGAADQGVFAHNLEDGSTRRLSTEAGPKSQPAVSGDLAVWTDERDGDRDVYGYDLAAGKEFVVIQAPEAQDDPHIDGTRVVWSDARGPNRDISAAQLMLPREAKPARSAKPAASVAVPASAPAAPDGERLRVVGTAGEGVNLRAAPGLDAVTLKTLPEGTVLSASGDPRQADGLAWRNVRDADGASGWVAAEFLAPAPSP